MWSVVEEEININIELELTLKNGFMDCF